jgi:hypothetical protein
MRAGGIRDPPDEPGLALARYTDCGDEQQVTIAGEAYRLIDYFQD